MPLVTGVAISANPDLAAAIAEAGQKAHAACPSPALVLAFITHNYPKAQLADAARALAELFPKAETAGGQINGITYGDERYDAVFANRHAVAIVAFGGQGVRGTIALADNSIADPREMGRGVARTVLQRLGTEAVGGVFLGIGISQIPPIDQAVLDGIRDVAPRLRLTGTGLCGGMQMDGSYDPGVAFHGTTLVDKGVLVGVLGGDLRLGFGAANGMVSTGQGSFITKAYGPVIAELGGRPAKDVVLDLFTAGEPGSREMFEKNPQVMGVEKGITLGAPDPEGDFFWCHPPAAFTPEGGVLDLFSPKMGTGLAVTRITSDSCMGAVESAAEMVRQDAASESFEMTLSFSCSLRGFTLGATAAKEDAELRKHIKARNHLGIVANGEIGCYRHGRPMFTCWVFAMMGAVERADG